MCNFASIAYFSAMKSDEWFMRRCLELAAKGTAKVAPNPMVGAVVVHEGKIVGNGFHRSYGEPHAEVHAINEVADLGVLKRSTLYVNMEPCSHFGKTPPCADLIIASGIPRVIIGQRDPNPLVAGSGIDKLKQAGIQVTSGVYEAQCLYLNRRFNTFHEMGRPYVVLKWARSLDGFMDKIRSDEEQSGVHWISHPATKKLVHRWRSEEKSILIGATTLANDDPSLTVRDFSGSNPHRMVLSHRGALSVKARLFHDALPIEVVSHQGGPVSPLLRDNGTLTWTAAQANENLVLAALRSLHKKGITSVLVEGGAETLGSFLSLGLWDEARIITSPRSMGTGKPAPRIDGILPDAQFQYGQDLISTYFRI